MFQYEFMTRALIAGVMLSLSASLLGTNLVLKRNSLIGDGLSHVGFGTMAIAMALNTQPLLFSMVIAIISAYFIFRLSQSSQVGGDALIGIISASALAIGVIVIELFGVNADISSYMFGSILAVSRTDMIVSIIIGTSVLIGYVLLYNRIFVMTFDETFAKAIGQKTEWYNAILSILTAIVVVVGMRLMGALLISGLIIFPTIIAMQWFDSFKKVTIASALFGVTNFILGLVFAILLNTPTGASVIVVNLLVLILSILLKRLRQ